MRKILAIVIQDLRVFLADRSNLPGLLFTPVVMTVIIGLVNGGAFGGDSTIFTLDVIDRDQSEASSEFLQAISSADPNLVLCPMENDPANNPCAFAADQVLNVELGLARVADGTSVGLLIIPAEFSKSIENRQSAQVALHTLSDFGSGQTAQQAVEAALEQINGAAAAAQAGGAMLQQIQTESQRQMDIEAAIYQQALSIWQQRPVRVMMELSGSEENRSLAGSLQQGLGQSVPGMGTMFVMMTVFGGMAALIEERRQWTLPRLAVMPVSRAGLVAAKVISRFTLGLIQFLVVFAVGAAFGMNFGKDPLALLLVAISFTLATTALSLAIGSRLENPSQAAGLTLLLTLVLAPLGGAWWPLEISPQFMQIAGRVSPVSWAMMAFTDLTYENAQLAQVYPSILVLLGIALLAFLIAIPRFRFSDAE